MSDVAEAATVKLLLADYATADNATGRLHVIGGQLSVISPPDQLVAGDPLAMANTAPMCVVALVSVPPEYYHAEVALELILEDDSGEPVQVPGPAGAPIPLRIAQNVQFPEPVVQGVSVPRKVLHAKAQFVLSFATGIPLALGKRYQWRVKLDHHTCPQWTETFYVPGPPAQPVIG